MLSIVCINNSQFCIIVHATNFDITDLRVTFIFAFKLLEYPMCEMERKTHFVRVLFIGVIICFFRVNL